MCFLCCCRGRLGVVGVLLVVPWLPLFVQVAVRRIFSVGVNDRAGNRAVFCFRDQKNVALFLFYMRVWIKLMNKEH